MRSQPRPHGSVWIKGMSRLMRIYVLANSYIRLGSVVYTRWRMPVQALADACESGVHGAKTTN